tara:strand:- start:105 stop:377 length:273 start_codon:yes stop_codon:yes gene_type:complete
MYSFFYGEYFYKEQLLEWIEEIDIKRKLRKQKGSTVSSSFAMDLKDKLNGIEEVKILNKIKSTGDINENIKMKISDKEIKEYVSNQFKAN